MHFDLAAKLNPSDADALILGAKGHAYIGDPAKGLEFARQAVRLNPYYPEWYRLYLLGTFFLAHRYEDAFEASHFLSVQLPDTAAWRAAASVQVDRLAEARALLNQFFENLRAIWVGETPPGPDDYKKYLLDANPMGREEDVEHLLDSLRKAGLPE